MANENQTQVEHDEFKLEVPSSPAPLSEVALNKAVTDNLDGQVEDIFQEILNTPAKSKELKALAEVLEKMGDEEITQTSRISNRMLDTPIRMMASNKGDSEDEIAKNLKKLRSTVIDLDPKQNQKLFSRTKILGFTIPFSIGKKVDNGLQNLKSAKDQIDDIVKALNNGKDLLQEDNAYIEEERDTMYALMEKLEQYSYVMKKLDEKIASKIEEVRSVDARKAKDIEQEILFPIRQKRMDIIQHLGVTTQGYMALEIVQENNEQLIKGVNRATKTTISALQTAVIISEALAAQKSVNRQVQEVNDLTNRTMENNADALNAQGVEIQKMASASAINAETLERTFQKIFKAMDAIDNYKANALPVMEKTLQNMERTVTNAKSYLSNHREEGLKEIKEEIFNKVEDTKPDDGIVKIKKAKM